MQSQEQTNPADPPGKTVKKQQKNEIRHRFCCAAVKNISMNGFYLQCEECFSVLERLFASPILVAICTIKEEKRNYIYKKNYIYNIIYQQSPTRSNVAHVNTANSRALPLYKIQYDNHIPMCPSMNCLVGWDSGEQLRLWAGSVAS